MPENGDEIKLLIASVASVAPLTRYVLSILFIENAGVLAHTHGFSFSSSFATPPWWVLSAPPFDVDSTLRAKTAWRC